jgi:hypothetical protein
MKIIRLIFFLGLVTSIDGCGFEEMRKRTEELHDITLSKCKCDDVRLINYSEENFRTYAHLEIIGSNEVLRKEIANKINEALKDSVSDYCKIDELKLDFLNKGTHDIITIRYCKINE